MARQGFVTKSRVGEGSLEDNSSTEGNKSTKDINWGKCSSLEKCNRSEEGINSKDMSLKKGRLEENNFGESDVGGDNKLEEGTSKETNDGEFVNIGE
jgi:hypothetical protein